MATSFGARLIESDGLVELSAVLGKAQGRARLGRQFAQVQLEQGSPKVLEDESCRRMAVRVLPVSISRKMLSPSAE
jgi:hypothetical protein